MEQLQTSREEYRNRTERLLDKARDDGYDGVVLFGTLNIRYICGLVTHPLERPVALGITEDDVQLVVPRIEEASARKSDFEYSDVHVYFDYPQGAPMDLVVEMCRGLGIDDGVIATDSDGSPARYGYQGPSLSSLVDGEVGVERYVYQLRERKSQTEIDLIRYAGTWANVGHRHLQERLAVGRRPEVVTREAETETIAAMHDALADKYVEHGWHDPNLSCIDVGFTLQHLIAGEMEANLRWFDPSARLQDGDMVITIVTPAISGYNCELERTLFVGEPTQEQREYFEVMTEAQELAIEALGPGVEFGVVEDTVNDYFDEQGVRRYTQHHVGHNIGLEGHELPVLDAGYEGTVSTGEVYTIEPGFYVPGVGGFRHSDTVAVTEDGTEVLTYYPRDIESLTVRG